MDVLELVNATISVLNQWRSVQDNSYDRFLGYMHQEDGLEQWHPPMLNRDKVNVDAALFEEPHRHSYALIVRDHHGNLIEANSRCTSGRVSPELAEAIGIREALSWVKNRKEYEAIVETDCLQVVQLIRSSYSTISYLGRIIEECKDLLNELQSSKPLS